MTIILKNSTMIQFQNLCCLIFWFSSDFIIIKLLLYDFFKLKRGKNELHYFLLGYLIESII